MADCAGSQSLPRYGAIMLMGLTGSGKSTFIASLTGDSSRVGKSLESCTRICEAIEYQPPEFYHTVFLIDTPGFDDTSRSEIEILREIAGTLQVLAELQVDLHGIIYLHRITDPRVSGAAMKSLRVLEKICGEDAYKNVFLVTTMWDRLDDTKEGHKIGEDREEELCGKPFWGALRNGEATSMRLSTGNNRSDTKKVLNAREIVKLLRERHPTSLLIQREMKESGETLANTSAGMFLEENMDALQRRHQKDLAALERELEDAANEGDRETMSLIREDLNRSIGETERLEAQLQELRTTQKFPRGGTPGDVPRQLLGSATSIPHQTSEGNQCPRKPVPFTASFLNKAFKTVRDGYKSSVSERGRGSSGVGDPKSSDNIVVAQQQVQLESGLQKPDNILKARGESNEIGVGNPQLPEVASNDVQSAGRSAPCAAPSSCTYRSSETQTPTPAAAPSPTPATSKRASKSLTAGIVESRNKILGRLSEMRLPKERSSTSRENYQPSDMALGAARTAMPNTKTDNTVNTGAR